MASMVSSITVQEKGIRNKRKFRADPSFRGDPNKIITSIQNECLSYEFSTEKFKLIPSHAQPNSCNLCNVDQDQSDGLKLDLGLSSSIVPSDFGPSQPKEDNKLETDEFQDADWSDFTETELEELVLTNLDAIFKTAIKKIIGCGYVEEIAIKAVSRSGICCGCKDIVSNIVDNALELLRSEKEIDHSTEHYFEDLEQLEKYILAELVCVLQEVRPFFSTGDAMWCLLICDLNVTHACAVESNCLSGIVMDSTSKSESCETNLQNPSLPIPSTTCFPLSSQSEDPKMTELANIIKSKGSLILGGLESEKDGTDSKPANADKEKFGVSRKVRSVTTKREHMLKQKSLHLEKNFRTYGSKASSKSGERSGLGGLVLENQLKSLPDSSTVKLKNDSLMISKSMGTNVTQEKQNHYLPANAEPSSPLAFNSDALSTISEFRKKSIELAEDAALSLSLPPQRNNAQDKLNEVILKLVPREQELKKQLQEWTEWANQKVMQAARRLSKDKAELKTLRQEREEVERLKKEKQTLEENTMKKHTEMENALCKAGGQVKRTNSTVRRLEVENSVLRQEMEAAKLHAAESAASCQEISKREIKTSMKFQSWEKQRTLLQEEFANEKRKLTQLLREVEQARDLQEQLEAKWRAEEKSKDELLIQAASIRKEREQIEAKAKSKEDTTISNAETNREKYKDDIQKMEKEISQLQLKTDSSKIAELRRGIMGSRNSSDQESPTVNIPVLNNLYDYSGIGDLKCEWECVMCLSEEMSVVFLPCAHQVVCVTCNELHEKRGMKDCPSCRCPIQQRISVRFSRP